MAAIDADDEPTARLALLVAPCYLLSKDRALATTGLATAEWLPVAIALQLTGLVNGSMYSVTGLTVGVGWGVQALVRTARRHPRLTLLGLAAIGAGLIMRGDRLAADVERVVEAGKVVADRLGPAMAQLLLEQHEALLAIDGPLIKASIDTPVARVAGALVRDRWPVAAATPLADRTGLTRAEVQNVLAAHEAFVRGEYGWQLGTTGQRLPTAGVGLRVLEPQPGDLE